MSHNPFSSRLKSQPMRSQMSSSPLGMKFDSRPKVGWDACPSLRQLSVCYYSTIHFGVATHMMPSLQPAVSHVIRGQ